MSIPQPVFRCFQCTTTDNLDNSFTLANSYIQHNEPYSIVDSKHCHNNEQYEYTLFGYCLNESIWYNEEDLQVFWSLARKGSMQLDHAAIQGDLYVSNDFFTIRKWICELYLSCRTIFTSKFGEEIYNDLNLSLSSLTKYIKRLKDIPDYVLFNQNNNASLNYLHLSLDISWLKLTTEHYFENESLKLSMFEHNLNTILCDLINISLRKFDKNSQNLVKNSPFLCSCFKEIWLLIQLYVEYLNEKKFCKDFWYYFNIALKSEINFQNSLNGKENLLAIWITFHVSKIHGYDKNGTYVGQNSIRIVSNYSVVEQNLKIIINNNHTDETMNEFLQILSNLQLVLWTKDSTFDLLQVLWEYFCKKLNYPFSGDAENLYSCKQYDYNSLTLNILNLEIEQGNNYELFLNLLGKYLTKIPNHWPKLKGRIYSKLSPPKIGCLTDVGMHNLIQLFFVLSCSVNFKELSEKLSQILNQIPVNKSENNSIIWSAHISLLIMKINKGFSLIDISEIFLNSVLKNSSDRSQNHLMKIYIGGLKKIIELDNELRCNEYILFGNWINKYLQWCSYTDACELLKILKDLVEIVSKKGCGQDWWVVIEKNIVESVIFLSQNPDAPIELAELSSTLVFCQKFNHLLEHLTGDQIPVNLSVKFMVNVLKNNIQFSLNQQTLLIQCWIRISILHTDKNDIKELTSLLRFLPIFETFNLSLNSDDALYELIRNTGLKMRDAKNIQEISEIKKWMEMYFGKMDKWIAPVLGYGEKGENSALLFKVYTIAAVLFLHCAPALYIKNKNTCILYRVTTTLLLPSSVLLNKRPSNLILTALKRTWHLFIRGIARLDFKQDNYIDRTLKDLVIRYLPHMYDINSPLIRCIDNEFEENASVFVIEKISAILCCKSKNTHEHSLPALKIILEMFKKCDLKFKIFVSYIFNSICEQLMFTEDTTAKNIIMQILNEIKTNKNYFQIKEIIKNSILNVIDKHLAFYSLNVFKILENLTSVICQEINECLPQLKEAIRKVECMRGVGYDNNLRKGLQKLEELTNKCN